MHLAETGLCEHGEQESLIQSGATRRDGRLPVNTDGGCLANGEPIGASGLRQVHEVVAAAPRRGGGAPDRRAGARRLHAGLRRAGGQRVHRAQPLSGREVQLASYPDGEPRTSDFRIVDVPVREPGPGEVLVRNTWTSVDAGLRLRLAERAPAGYFPAFGLRAALDGIMTVGEVIESRADGFAVGDTVWHASGWRDYAVVAAGTPALGGLGTLTRLDTGHRSRAALPRPARRHGPDRLRRAVRRGGASRAGDVVWVSAAAGAVGSLAAQFAKLRGHRVIGSAGSDEKVSYLLDELGLDAAFNHRAGPVADLLRAAVPEGIDVYFDCVGGDHLEAALAALRPRGRVALCGAVSQYGRPARGPANLFQATANDLTLRGFRGSSHLHRMGDMVRDVERLARRRAAALPRDDRRRPRAGARGARADAGRRHDRQDARAHRLIRPCASCPRIAAARGRAWAIASPAARPSAIACEALRGTSASPITRTVPARGTSALQSRATRSPTTMTCLRGHALDGARHRVPQDRAVLAEARRAP